MNAHALPARKSRPRGYLMLDVVIASVLVGSGFAIGIEQIASARTDVSLAARRGTATGLARAKLDRILTHMPVELPDQADFTRAGLEANPSMQWRWTVADNTADLWSTPRPRARLVTVVVSYAAPRGDVEDQRDGKVDGRGEVSMARQWVER